jgi:hypothetical protein
MPPHLLKGQPHLLGAEQCQGVAIVNIADGGNIANIASIADGVCHNPADGFRSGRDAGLLRPPAV